MPLCNSPVDCAKELSKPSKDLVSLPVYNEKNFFWFWVSGILWVTSYVG